MSWPVGYGVARVKYSAARDGTIFADGVAVTSANGWLDLATAPSLRRASVPESYSLRVRLSVDAAGKPFFYAEEVELGAQRYGGLLALAKARGGEWLSAPVVAAREEIEARRQAGLAARATTARSAEGETRAANGARRTRRTTSGERLRASREDTWTGLEKIPGG